MVTDHTTTYYNRRLEVTRQSRIARVCSLIVRSHLSKRENHGRHSDVNKPATKISKMELFIDADKLSIICSITAVTVKLNLALRSCHCISIICFISDTKEVVTKISVLISTHSSMFHKLAIRRIQLTIASLTIACI